MSSPDTSLHFAGCRWLPAPLPRPAVARTSTAERGTPRTSVTPRPVAPTAPMECASSRYLVPETQSGIEGRGQSTKRACQKCVVPTIHRLGANGVVLTTHVFPRLPTCIAVAGCGGWAAQRGAVARLQGHDLAQSREVALHAYGTRVARTARRARERADMDSLNRQKTANRNGMPGKQNSPEKGVRPWLCSSECPQHPAV